MQRGRWGLGETRTGGRGVWRIRSRSEEGTDGKEGRKEGKEKARGESSKVRRGRRWWGAAGGGAASLSVCD